MNSVGADSIQYCSDYVRRRDEDRWLAAQFAAPVLRGQLLALYALHAEISDVPGKVSEPTLGAIRLQWWREALAEVENRRCARAHPVIQAISEAGVIDAHAGGKFAEAIDARGRLLYDEPFADIGDLIGWLNKAEAFLAVLAARLAASTVAEGAITDAATAYALSRFGAALAPHLASEAEDHAATLLGRALPELRGLSAAAAPALLHLTLARAYVYARREPSPLAKRGRLFAAMTTGRL